ncbi:MAG: glucokinase [Xanthomonadales bacterium]|nr:glucokinase [Xanthomonadales bacterium]
MNDRSDCTLLADIGGTHARFALGACADEPVRVSSVRHYAVADFDSFAAAARHYFEELDVQPQAAVLSVAGPIMDDGVRFTNNPWQIKTASACAALGLAKLKLINDFTAMSRGLPLLGADQLEPLDDLGVAQVGGQGDQTFAVIGPGTGLGVGALLLRDGRAFALQTEGGHTSFAPTTALQVQLLALMHRRIGHVFNESLISGHGLLTLYQALAEIENCPATCSAPEQITRAADSGEDGLSVRTLEVFSVIFGAIAGDAALMFGAWDGVFLAGGLSPIVAPWLRRDGCFRHHFEDKDERRDVLQAVPIGIIVDGDAGLYGAAAVAMSEKT